MERRAHKVAIYLRDGEIAARVVRVATDAGLEILRPPSLSAVTCHLHDPLLGAIVTDIPAPRDGGVTALERLHRPFSRAVVAIVADLDAATAAALAAIGLEATVFPPRSLDEAELARLMCRGEAPAHFGPAEMDNCLESHDFWVEYQPKVSLQGASAASQFGVEALCRMRDPRLGMISPDKFIPMAEKCGLIAKLTDAVTCEAFKAWGAWKAQGLCLRLALNVSPVLLGDAAWSQQFLRRCSEFGVEPQGITLEITETAAGATDPRACEILTQLQRKGFSLSIDDFGTGFSSLATLYRLPIAEMKIDKSFVLDLEASAGARHLVESAIAMAGRMGIKVVAEGVESESVFEELRRMGCHEVQGYFVGKPMRAEAVTGFFTQWRQSGRSEQPTDAAAAGLPKIVILQALLNDIVGDRSLETGAVPRGPYSSQAAAPSGNAPKELLRKLPPLVLEGRTLPALALCHDVLHRLEGLPACNDMRGKVGLLQSHLEQELGTGADLELRSQRKLFRLLPRESVTLGRPSASARVDIPVQCRWLSGGEKNLRIFSQAGRWYIEDLGSAHGYLIDERRMVPRRPLELPLGETIVEVRLASGAVAPLSLVLRRAILNPDAVAVSFDYDAQSLRGELGEKDWSEIEDELDCIWVVFNGVISVGSLVDCTLSLRECAFPTAAAIYFRDGYWICPGEEAAFAMDGVAFRQAVPFAAKSELMLGDCRVTVREIDRAAATARGTIGPAKHLA